MTRIWEVTFRVDYGSDNIFDRVNVTARTALEALKKANQVMLKDGYNRVLVPTGVTLLAQAK